MLALILGAGVQENKHATELFNQQLYTLNQQGINKISFVGGNDLYKYINLYPNLNYFFNENWKTHGVLSSLLLAKELFNGKEDIIVTYSDILFSKATLESILKANTPFTIAAKKLDQGIGSHLLKAEKVLVENGMVKEIGKKIAANNQFLGIMKISATEQLKIKRFFNYIEQNQTIKFHEAQNISKAYLTDFIHIYAQTNPVCVELIDTAWTELDHQEDIERFIFGTKAETLQSLKKQIQKSIILDQVCIEVGEWTTDQDECVTTIQNSFKNDDLLVVRSSTFAEDSEKESFAGAFESVLNVKRESKESINAAIKVVIDSYKKYNLENLQKNQILIQPQLQDVQISGVVMTRDLTTGAPYYIVNYDDQSKLTDTITSGIKNLKSLVCLHNQINNVSNIQLRKLLQAIQEVEETINSSALDIEFAITGSNVYLFQVRPITTLHGQDLSELDAIHSYIQSESENYKQLVYRKSSDLFGEKSIYANMPDWNPAEIIGIRPKPLASSLYKYLITDEIWLQSRQEIGYHVPTSEVLLQMFCGQPYIDTRVSFNTLIPKDFSVYNKEKLINYYIKKLQENPHLHDKVEFEILYTCYDFTLLERLKELNKSGFTQTEIKNIGETLLNFTNNILLGNVGPIFKQLQRLKVLEEKRDYILSHNKNSIYVVRTLLDDCRKYGTLPFSIFARYAFISMSLLKSLVATKVITQIQYERYLASIETVATDTIQDLNLLTEGTLTKEKFLKRHGHLRPGTYDITSPRYDEAFNSYFSLKEDSLMNNKMINNNTVGPVFNQDDYEKIDKVLVEHGIKVNAEELFSFIQKSIEGREFAKFEFTKNLSMALKIIKELALVKGFSIDEIQFLSIEDILKANTLDKGFCETIINYNKKTYEIVELVKLPSIITNIKDFKLFTHFESQPNYITRQSVTADVLVLSDAETKQDGSIYTGKVILIESADPGYDWLFSYNIAGLITKFGGANSHMAIRCAEFNLPAAIGCGEIIYNNIKIAQKILLNCGAEQIEVI